MSTTTTKYDAGSAQVIGDYYPTTFPKESEVRDSKIIVVAIPVILGVAGLIVAAVGITFMIHTGTFGALSQSHSIAVISACGTAGLVACIIAGVIYKCWPNSQSHKTSASHTNMTHRHRHSNSTLNGNLRVPTEEGKVFRPLLPAERVLNKWVERPTYFNQADELQRATDFKISAGLEKTLVILEQRYLWKEDVALLDYRGHMYTAPSSGQPINFGIMPPNKLPDINTPEGKEATENLIKALRDHAIPNMRAYRIPKLFVPISVEPAGHVDHGLLLVIELDDPNPPRMTVIDPFGHATSPIYKNCGELLLGLGKYIFPPGSFTVAANQTQQQFDDWSCGWQMLENIDLLSKQRNVQEYVCTPNQLPKRNESRIKDVVAGYGKIGAEAIKYLVDNQRK